MYATELERSLLNVVFATISADGNGIRYFARLQQGKEDATNQSTCCEGQGTRQLGALPEYLFSTSNSSASMYVHLYQASVFTTAGFTLRCDTTFPYNDKVTIQVQGPASSTHPLELYIRVRSWVKRRRSASMALERTSLPSEDLRTS